MSGGRSDGIYLPGDSQDQLAIFTANELLPSINPLLRLAGVGLVASVGVAIFLMSILKYKVVVKAPAILRPVGELRVVQASVSGAVIQIYGHENQTVQAGQILARLDDSRLRTRTSQLESEMQQKNLQLLQIKAQLDALAAQLQAETTLSQRNLTAAQANLQFRKRQYQQQIVATQADLEEAIAAKDLAEQELKRYQDLEGSGAISASQMSEKVAVARAATARVQKMQGAINPSSAEIEIARAQVSQEQARGRATIANLQQQRQQLLQRQTDLNEQLQLTRKELSQAQIEQQQSVLRASASGTLLELGLRNQGQFIQAGQPIAYIAPKSSALVIKTRIQSQDINRVRRGQLVQMQISACPHPDYGTLKGIVLTVAPDVLPESPDAARMNSSQGGGQSSPISSYAVTIKPQTNFISQGLSRCLLKAGMDGQVNIITQEETVLQFILRAARLVSSPAP
jgi:HlyD family secretion protein